MTLGLLVFVQLVIAAMSTDPSRSVLCSSWKGDWGKSFTLSGVGRSATISDSAAGSNPLRLNPLRLTLALRPSSEAAFP